MERSCITTVHVLREVMLEAFWPGINIGLEMPRGAVLPTVG